jgi:hypothetical protein
VGVCTVNYVPTRGPSLHCNASFIAFAVSQFEYNFYLEQIWPPVRRNGIYKTRPRDGSVE